MYTVLIQNNNSAIVTERQRIMQNSKLVDVLQIVVPKLYGEQDMSQYIARLEYRTPITHKNNYVELEIADGEYKTDYLLYKMKIDTNLTSEVGDVEFMMTFLEVTMTENGKVETPVRKTDVFTMPVIPIADWFSVPDSALATLDQRIIANQQAIMAMADLQSFLADTKADDLSFEDNTLQLMANGKKIGTPQKLDDEMKAVDIDSSDDSQNGDFDVVAF